VLVLQGSRHAERVADLAVRTRESRC